MYFYRYFYIKIDLMHFHTLFTSIILILCVGVDLGLKSVTYNVVE